MNRSTLFFLVHGIVALGLIGYGGLKIHTGMSFRGITNVVLGVVLLLLGDRVAKKSGSA